MAESVGQDSINNNGIKEPLLGESSDSKQEDDVEIALSPHLAESRFGYNADDRPCRDVAFAIIFLVFMVASLSFGIFATVHHNPHYRWIAPAHYQRNQSRCVVDSSQVRGVWLEVKAGNKFTTKDWKHLLDFGNKMGIDIDKFGVTLIASLVATLFLSLPVVLSLIWLLRSYAKQLVYASLPLFVLFPVGLNVFWFVACIKDTNCQESLSLPIRIMFFVFIFIFCAIIVWIIFANFPRIELTIQVLSTASRALYDNLLMLLIVPLLALLLLLVYVPTGFFLAYSYANGNYSPHPDLKDRPELPCGRGTSRECCVWKTESWVPAYMALAIFSALWATAVIAQAKVYTISGTISQWYFAPVNQPTFGALRRSLGHAFGSSFGTLCFSGFVWALVRVVRSVVDGAKASQGREGIAVSFLRCCYGWVLQGVEFLNKFTLDFAAITGESFCSSASLTYELLKRNLLSTVVVEVISTRLMIGVTFVTSVVYAVLVWGVLQWATGLGSKVYIVTASCWALLIALLLVYIAVMNIVVDAVYICYAMDKDRNVVSKPEAHEVYVLLPVSRDEDKVALAIPNQAFV